MWRRAIYLAILFAPITQTSVAFESPTPTFANVPYGDDPRQVLDLFQAKSDGPAPLLFFIHGGGWINGDKAGFDNTAPYLNAGISIVRIEYRFVTQAAAAGVEPPLSWPLHDAARALQFTRSKAAEWNLDTKHIVACGSSAGACSSLWLAFHDDMADPTSSDPVARESTRLTYVAVAKAQTSLDPKQMREWIPNNDYGSHAFGFVDEKKDADGRFQDFFDARERLLPWINEYSPYALVTPDDPAVYLIYNYPPAMGKDDEAPAHSTNFGVGLKAKLDEVGVPCELVYPGAPDVRHATFQEYIIEKLGTRE